MCACISISICGTCVNGECILKNLHQQMAHHPATTTFVVVRGINIQHTLYILNTYSKRKKANFFCFHGECSFVCVRDAIAVYPNRIINENSIIILVMFRLICYLLSKLYLMFCIHIHIFVHSYYYYRFVYIFQHNTVRIAASPCQHT